MWRVFRPRAGISNASTLAVRAVAPQVPSQQTVIVQRVKLSKPRFRAGYVHIAQIVSSVLSLTLRLEHSSSEQAFHSRAGTFTGPPF